MRRLPRKEQRLALIDGLTPVWRETLNRDWPVFLHPAQRPPERPPEVTPGGDWRTWLFLGGRGAGKTRTGAEWLTGIIHGDPHYLADSAGRIALIGETFQDVRQVMIEGESGLLSVQRKDRKPEWLPSRRLLQWPNGAIAQVFSANDPDGLRGNQFGLAWADARTIWGSLIAVAAALGSILGVSLDQATQTELADIVVQLAGAAGALVAIYGRLAATEIIS